MKSEIKIAKTKQAYPCLMESADRRTEGLVVLFSSEKSGTIIKLPNDPAVNIWKLGQRVEGDWAAMKPVQPGTQVILTA